MNYPLISEYIDAIKNAEDNFNELTNLRPVYNDEGDIIMSSGNYAVVFKMTDGEKFYAVKCFTREQEGREEAYSLISKELCKVDSPYIVKTKYYKRELFVDTTQSEDNEFPVLIMDWIEGKTLSAFLHDIASEYEIRCSYWSQYEEDCVLFELRCLPANFLRMSSWLLKQSFAHGDLKPDNIIIKEDGACVMIDYDGMYVPLMKGIPQKNMGTPNYIHPIYNTNNLNKDADNYAISIIALSLQAFSINPELLIHANDFCIIEGNNVLSNYVYLLNQNTSLLLDDSFKDLLSIFTHVLSRNTLNPEYFDYSVSNILSNPHFDQFNTEVSDDEILYAWKDKYGVLYSLDGKKVLRSTQSLNGMEYHIREGVRVICSRAFQGQKLKAIILPPSVISIGGLAFANNDNMEYCNIPQSVQYIEDNNPWGGCFNIKSMNNLSPSYTIDDGILYSSDYKTAYGFIYWHQDVSLRGNTKKIAANAFWSSRTKYENSIKNVNLGTVEKIGYHAFDSCKAATFTQGCLNQLDYGAFENCKSLESIDISRVTSIRKRTFYGCDKMNTITFSDELMYIGEKAFEGCQSLRKLNIPNAVIFISSDSLDGCVALESIQVAENNICYCSEDGVLYNKDRSIILKFPGNKTSDEFVIPDTVQTVNDSSFSNNEYIKSIICNHPLQSFKANVFNGTSHISNCEITLDEKADIESLWNLGYYILCNKQLSAETHSYGYELIQKAAEMNHPLSQLLLAWSYKYAWNGVSDNAKYIFWLRRSANNDCHRAIAELGIALYVGKVVQRDCCESFKLLNHLDELGPDIARICKGNFYAILGLIYERGEVNKKQNFEMAVDYYRKGTKWSDGNAEYFLGRCFEYGRGVSVDLSEAKMLYSNAKSRGRKGASEALERVLNKLKPNDDLPF